MAKLCSTALSMVVTLLVFLSTCVNAQPVGFGITDFNLNVNITDRETKKFEAAKLYNTGDSALNITSTWVPNYNSTSLTVKLSPNPLFLMPGESASVYLNATGTELGSYGGYLDFSCDVELSENNTGNPTAPGGRANAVFNVVGRLPASILPVIVAEISIVVISIIGILVGVGLHQKRARRLHV